VVLYQSDRHFFRAVYCHGLMCYAGRKWTTSPQTWHVNS
jgi:hypothetical protein